LRCDGQPLKVNDFERFLELVAQSTGSTHDLLLDVRLRWQFSFWRNSGCRLQDAADMRALGLD